jgi:hypothetical protein
VILATVLGSLVIALIAAVFGVWQSAYAPSVRAIVESGGILRLAIILTVFFIGPWLLGLLSPAGRAPAVSAGGRTLSVESVRAGVTARPGIFLALVLVAVACGTVGLILLTRDTLRRCRRERLAMVGDDGPQSH